MGKPLFVLASASPRRKQLLQSIGLNAQIMPSNIDEDKLKGLPPEKMVSQLAMLKATDVARSFRGKTYVIGADTCVFLDDEILGKPQNIADAKRIMASIL